MNSNSAPLWCSCASTSCIQTASFKCVREKLSTSTSILFVRTVSHFNKMETVAPKMREYSRAI